MPFVNPYALEHNFKTNIPFRSVSYLLFDRRTIPNIRQISIDHPTRYAQLNRFVDVFQKYGYFFIKIT